MPDQRSLEFNENNKTNPSAVATAELGPWTRASSQWTADVDDRTWNAGFGTTIQLLPERVTLIADYTVSLADIDIGYAGYGVTNFDGTPFPPNHQFAFSSPPTVREDLHVVNIRVEIPVKTVLLIAGYSYENYTLADWQQDSEAPWVEAVGADTLLRDTSRSYQWGNRLFNLGTLLAPSYVAHIGFVGFRYRF
jgi:Putative outer membrane beta-barrel porin, MtrB/PioB